MNTIIRPRFLLTAAAGAGLALAAISGPAQSANGIAQARAECAQHKSKVQRLESRASDLDSDPTLIRARQEWESACARASKLMEQAGMADQPKRVVQPRSQSSLQVTPSATLEPAALR